MPRAKITFTPILPRAAFESKIYKDAWERTLREQVRPDLRREFKKTVEGWEHKPVFRGTINKSTEYLRLLVKPVGKNAALYAMMDISGAKPHVITPRNAPQLAFQSGYLAATRPRVIKSRRKRRSGPIVTARRVRHPGFEAREFSETIAEQYQRTYVKHMNKATKAATVAMGRTF